MTYVAPSPALRPAEMHRRAQWLSSIFAADRVSSMTVMARNRMMVPLMNDWTDCGRQIVMFEPGLVGDLSRSAFEGMRAGDLNRIGHNCVMLDLEAAQLFFPEDPDRNELDDLLRPDFSDAGLVTFAVADRCLIGENGWTSFAHEAEMLAITRRDGQPDPLAGWMISLVKVSPRGDLDGAPLIRWANVGFTDDEDLDAQMGVEAANASPLSRYKVPIEVVPSVRAVLGCLAYLAQKNPPDVVSVAPELRIARTKKERIAERKVAQHPTAVTGVGWALAEARQRFEATRREAGETTGRTVAPHLRKPHWHRYAVGPGRTEREWRFLADWIPVNAHLGELKKPSRIVRAR